MRLYGARCSRQCAKIAAAVSAVGRPAGGEHDVRLGHGQPHRVGRRHHRRLGHRLVLDQHALQLERRDPVVGGLEHVVGAPDVGDVAVGVARADVAGVVVAAGHRLGVALRRRRGSRPSARAGRSDRSRQISPSSAGSPVDRVEQRDRVARAAAGPSSRACTGCPGVLATCTVVSVCPKPSRMVTPQARRTCSMTSGFSGSPAPTTSRGGVRSVRQVGLDQHPPHGRRGAEAGHRRTGPSRPAARPASNRV